MQRPLQGKVALVAGASRGLGRALAVRLAKQGAGVALVARGREDLDEAAAHVRRFRVRALPLQSDLEEPGEIERSLQLTREELGGLDLIVDLSDREGLYHAAAAHPPLRFLAVTRRAGLGWPERSGVELVTLRLEGAIDEERVAEAARFLAEFPGPAWPVALHLRLTAPM